MSSREGRFNKDCYGSTVRNTSGVERRFGFLPPHGAKLSAGGVYHVFGNVFEAVGRGDRATDQRHHQALADAIDRGDIEVTSTPSIILTDTGTDAVKQITLHNGTLSAADPCWDTSDSLDSEVAP